MGEFQTCSNWPLVVASKANLPFLLPLEKIGMQVKGEVYQIDEKMLSFLDEFEGHPRTYIRRKILVEPMNPQPISGQSLKECWCYFYNSEKNSPGDQKLLNGSVFLESYDSRGDHGKPYIGTEDIDHLEFP